MPTCEYIVSGWVQGVGYRYFAVRVAERLGVTGYVRNLPTGQVQVVACAPAEVLEQLEQLLQEGPRMSRVTEVRCSQLSEQDFRGFEVRY